MNEQMRYSTRLKMVREIVQEFERRGLVQGGRFVWGWGIGMKVPGINSYHDDPAAVLRTCSDEQIAEIHAGYVQQ